MKKSSVFIAAAITIASLTGCAAPAGPSESAQSRQPAPSAENVQEPAPADSSAPSTQTQDTPLSAAVNSLSVNSSEKVAVVPDIAQVEYAVRTEASDAAACQRKNTESVSQVIDLLKSLNIEETSIQTSDYHMNPVYNYSGNTPRVTGYEAITTLTVSDLPIDGLDEILAQSVSTGINTIRSITYQASRYDESYQEALTAAVESAHQKALALADAAGCNVGKVISITETSGYSQARYSDQALTSGYRASVKFDSTKQELAEIMPGEIQVEAAIVVEYQIY